MAWTIKFTEYSLRQLKKFDKPVPQRVLEHMDERGAVLADPRVAGKNLVVPRKGSFWRYRVGCVRVICDIQDQVLVILVLEIGHRREVTARSRMI